MNNSMAQSLILFLTEYVFLNDSLEWTTQLHIFLFPGYIVRINISWVQDLKTHS